MNETEKETTLRTFDIQQILLQSFAERLFDKIDPLLKPSVLIAGVLIDKKVNEEYQIFIETNSGMYSSIETKGIIELLRENYGENIRKEEFIGEICRIYKSNIYEDTEKFVSDTVIVNGFFVYIVVELNKKCINKYHSLVKDKVDGYTIKRSFIESTVNVYLEKSKYMLSNWSVNQLFNMSESEILREAGNYFMYTIALAGRKYNSYFKLYDACNSISSLKYEGAEGFGRMIITEKDNSNICFILKLEEPIEINDARKIRKLLQITNNDLCIISDSEFIYGLGKQINDYDPISESIFEIKFIGFLKWEVLHNNKSLMFVENLQPNLLRERIDKEKFYSCSKRIFKDIAQSDVDNLWDIVNQAAKQKHGTMIVILDNAKNEASRLKNQSFVIEPVKITNDIIKQVTSIDGSVLIDREGICHSIGVILDGIATEKGDSSRGARYNSAVRYYEHFCQDSPTIIVIISEDGMINVIPDLVPLIKPSLIKSKIESLKEMSKSKSPERKAFFKLVNSFREIEFYLNEDQCKMINILKNKIANSNNFMQHPDLKPNKLLKDSYFEVE